MENSIYIGLSKQVVLQRNMDIIANNVANMNTNGYRGQNMVFSEFISDPRGQDDPLSFVVDHGQYQITDPGSVRITENPLDVSLTGPGFLGIQAPDGEVAYSRDGHFQQGLDGALVSGSGLSVVDQGGSPIIIPSGTTEINIDKKGVISNQNGAIAQLMIVEFEDIQKLEQLGNNLYRTDATTLPAEKTTVAQGTLESSNVKPVIEMTRMISTLRSFQGVQKILQTENERLRGAIQKLTQGG
ncbi:MAG: flagellar basal-body rod protein FlgF [Micavibrio sp.]|nr:MAG: flagellar basal-body rod protein FlgF [Micavibrio sp.]